MASRRTDAFVRHCFSVGIAPELTEVGKGSASIDFRPYSRLQKTNLPPPSRSFVVFEVKIQVALISRKLCNLPDAKLPLKNQANPYFINTTSVDKGYAPRHTCIHAAIFRKVQLFFNSFVVMLTSKRAEFQYDRR